MIDPRRHVPLRNIAWDAGHARAAIITKSPPMPSPPSKPRGFCGGSGYAFLKLHRGLRDPLWLDRARAFAMTAIAQCREARVRVGRGRYALWTGDIGLACYLSDCVTAIPRFPAVDVL
jgi:hypothetical protein